MTKILLKGRKTLTHPSIHPLYLTKANIIYNFFALIMLPGVNAFERYTGFIAHLSFTMLQEPNANRSLKRFVNVANVSQLDNGYQQLDVTSNVALQKKKKTKTKKTTTKNKKKKKTKKKKKNGIPFVDQKN